MIDGFFSQIGGLNPASPLEMDALRSKLSDSRRAVLAEQWELFTQSSLYLVAYRGAEAEVQARAAPLRAFDRPYRGGGGGRTNTQSHIIVYSPFTLCASVREMPGAIHFQVTTLD